MMTYFIVETIGFPGVPVGAAGGFPLERAEVVRGELELLARRNGQMDTEYTIVPPASWLALCPSTGEKAP